MPDRKSHHRSSRLSDDDQTSGDADQTAGDLDQTLSDTDQSSSERDQHAADRDQQSADRDQEGSDQGGDDAEGRSRSERDRARSADDRDRSSRARSKTASLRKENAARRDVVATDRDAAADARDQVAADIDAEIDLMEGQAIVGLNGEAVDELARQRRLSTERRRAQLSRARAATQREAAARDRRQAAEDREYAARALAESETELVMEGIDHLTGALRRRAGAVALQRELDRTGRGGESMVIAFVDLDGLKAINDNEGHAAGDGFLRQVAESIHQSMRSYDVMVRYGGDEFVCSLAGQDEVGARQRFEQIAARVADITGGQTITFGLAQARRDESLDELIVRADDAMIAGRRRP
jgi:diguanylate cyclase (GGDEF)-like protein